jgi:hypothetical protein
MSQIAVAPMQTFYWQIKFNDDYILSQFDVNGNEVLIKEFLGDDHWGLVDGVKTLRKTSNLFSNIEKLHGRAVKVGWYPFDEELAKKIMKVSGNNIYLVDQTEIHVMAIPANAFAFISKEIQFDWASKSPIRDADGNLKYDKNGEQMFVIHEPTAFQSDLYYGYLMRDIAIDGDIKHVRLNIMEKKDG